MKLNEYAAYRGDEFLVIGTAQEISEKLGIKLKTVYRYISDEYKSQVKDYNRSLIIIKLDKD